MRYRYVAGEGWIGPEPPNNLCKFSDVNISHRTNANWDFTDVHTTGKPVRIHGKAHWRRHLKEHGLTDDVDYSQKYLDQSDRERSRIPESKKQKIREAITDAIKVVSQRPYSTIGKPLSSSEIRSQLANARRQYERRTNG